MRRFSSFKKPVFRRQNLFNYFFFRNSPIGDGIPVSRSAPKDWDAPELEEDNPEAYEVPHGIKRKRRLIAREDSVSPPPQTLKFGEENEDRWTKKSKIPRLVKVWLF